MGFRSLIHPWEEPCREGEKKMWTSVGGELVLGSCVCCLCVGWATIKCMCTDQIENLKMMMQIRNRKSFRHYYYGNK